MVNYFPLPDNEKTGSVDLSCVHSNYSGRNNFKGHRAIRNTEFLLKRREKRAAAIMRSIVARPNGDHFCGIVNQRVNVELIIVTA